MSQYEIGGYLEYRKLSFHLILAILLVAAGCKKKGEELSSSALDSISKDSASPLTIEEPAPSTAIVNKSLTLAGYCLRGGMISFYGDIIEQAPVSCSDGSYRIKLTVTPTDGVKRINIRQLLGKKLLSASIQLYSDGTTPQIAVSSPAANSAVGSSVVLQGTCQDSLPLTVSFGSQSSTVACNNGNFETTLSLNSVTDGNVIINFEQTNTGGTKGTASLTLVKDTVIPSIAISEPAANATVGSSFVLKGSCQDSLPVIIKMNSKDYTVPCASSSFATTLLLTDISDGNVSLALEQTSATGNKGTASLTVKKNTAAPIITISTPAANSSVKNDVILQGTCQAPLTVTITVGSKAYTTTCSSGTFATTAPLTGSADGNVIVNLEQTSATGVKGTASVTVKKDTVAPVVKITSPASGATVPVTTTVSGTCEAGLTVAINGAGVSAPVNATCSSGGTFSSSVTMTSTTGTKVIDAIQTDAAGNSGSASVSVSYAATGPAIAFSTPSDSSYFKNTVAVTGTCQSGLTVNFSGAGWVSPATASCPSGTFAATITFTTGDGVKNLIASQTNGSNQTGTATRSFIRDETAPKVSIISPNSTLVTNSSSLQLTGVCETDGNAVVVSGSGVSTSSNLTCSNGAYSGNITLSSGDGSKTIQVSQSDAAGNSGSASVTFKKDSVAPVIKITSPASGATVPVTTTVSGTCEAGLTVAISGAGVSAPVNVTCSSGGTFSSSVTMTSTTGTKVIDAVQADAAGNNGSASVSVSYTATGPSIAFSTPSENSYFKSTVAVTGTCQSGLTVNFSGAGWVSPATASCPSGTFAATITFTTGDGVKNLIASQTNGSNQTGAASRSFIRDETAPSVNIMTPSSTLITNALAVQVAGACETGSNAVVVSGSGVSASSNLTCSNGAYSGNITLSSGDGSKTIQVTQTDGAGNSGSASVTFKKDSVAPVIKITSPASGATVPVTTIVSGTCEAGLTVAISGAGLSAPVNATCSSGTFSSSVTLTSTAGTKVIDAIQTDAAGNSGAASTSVSYIATSPSIAFSSPADSSYFKSTVAVTGTCQSGLTVNFSGAGWVSPATASCPSGTFAATITFTTGDGVKNLIASQTNGSNQTGTATRSFIRDETAPSISIMTPDVNFATKSTSIQITGACEKGNTNPVVVGGAVSASSNLTCSNGAYSGTITLSSGDGTKAVQVSQTDAAGNTGTASRNFILDTAVPSLAITSPNAGTATKDSLTIGGTCEAGLTVTIAGTGAASSTTINCTSGTFSKAVSLSSGDGTKTIQISQTDNAGNTGTHSRNFALDTAAPSLAISSPAAGTAGSSGLTISGSCESSLQITISGAGVASSTTANCISGTFSAAISFSSGDGSKTVQISQTDAVGNTGTNSRNFVRDTTAPALAFTSPAANTAAETGLTIVGTCESGLNISVAGTGVSATTGSCPSGSFSIGVTFTAGDGTKAVQISQTDALGNTGTASRSFNRVTASLDGAALYTQNCSLCHNALASSTKLNSTATQITSAINTISQMSGLKSLTSAQISAIASALVNTPPVDPIGKADATIPLGNRTFMESLYNELFVSSTSDTNVTTLSSSLLGKQIVAMGGPCLKYDSSCNSAQVDTAPFALGIPAGNTMRKGYATRACDQILEIDKAVTNALGKAGLNVSTTINASSVQTMFTLFNPGKTAPTDVVNSLVNVGTAAKSQNYSTTDQWRFTILPLCLSSTMDIL